MALRTARIQRVRGRPPLLAAGSTSLIHSHSSSVRSLGYVFSFIYPCYTTHEDFSDRLLEVYAIPTPWLHQDTTTIRLYGAYADAPKSLEAPHPAYGHSKDR